MAEPFKTIATKVIHAGTPRPRVSGAVVTPVFQSSTYEYLGEARYHDVAKPDDDRPGQEARKSPSGRRSRRDVFARSVCPAA